MTHWKRNLFLLLAALVLSPAPASRADIYRWIDADGNLHFTNTPVHSGYKLYIKSRPKTVESPPALPVEAGEIALLVKQYAELFKLEEPLLLAMIKAESNFNPGAVSRAGAQGLMQLMPETAVAMGITNPFDPGQSVYGGSRYLREQLDRFTDLDLALAAYNAGPSNVEKYGGVPPFNETRQYLVRVRNYLEQFRLPLAKEVHAAR